MKSYLIFLLVCLTVLLASCTVKNAGPSAVQPSETDSRNTNDREETSNSERDAGVTEETEVKHFDTENEETVPAETEAEKTETEAIETDAESHQIEINRETPEPPSEELLEQIIDDYAVYSKVPTEEDKAMLYVSLYYGNYNGAVPFLMGGESSATVMTVEKIAGYTFLYPDSNKIQVWKSGQFYSMEQAYENGFLTADQIAAIAYLFNAGKGIEYPNPNRE